MHCSRLFVPLSHWKIFTETKLKQLMKILKQLTDRLKRILILTMLGGWMLNSGSAVYDVRTFGAKGDGKTIDSPAINAALQKAAGTSQP